MEPLKNKPRILLVEDSLLSRKIAVRIIENCGCEADTAENGRDASEKVSANTYDLIIMDMFMPEMNGGDAATEIRKKGINTPIVALSANPVTPEEQNQYGFNDSLMKPISSTEVKRILSRYCHLEKPDEGRDSTPPPAADLSVFDEKGALEFAGGSRTVLTEMITLYIDGTKRNIDQLSSHLDSHDLQKAKSAAHLIKGESKSLGVKKVFSCAAEIEEAAKAGDREKGLSLIPELRNNFSEFNEALNSTGK
jgi:CheY-like chemotaxis protein/HPt (histidine-containing phosphotransfer) domain-containing protein